MDTVASLSGTDLEELFAEAAARMGVPDTIVEKDFWVCWSLKRLLALPGHWPDIVFKGGTSLSKVCKAIQRFSEDIDLVLDRKYFGCEGDREPLNAPSVSKMNRLIDALKDSCKGHIAEVVLPALRNDFASILHSGNDGNGWQLELASEDEDPDLQTINFHYPKSLREKSYSGADYIRPAVKLEFGCRGDLSPAIKATVRPYAAEVLPDQFFEPSCDVTALDAMRTFWEKATLLHVDSERPANKPYHGRNHPSRHYYDVVMLARSQIGQGAVSRIDLLNQVVAPQASVLSFAVGQVRDSSTWEFSSDSARAMAAHHTIRL